MLPQIFPLKKITESINYNTILEVNDENGEIYLLINLKYVTVVVADTAPPFKSTPHSTSIVFCETNVKHFQYNIEEATDHYI